MTEAVDALVSTDSAIIAAGAGCVEGAGSTMPGGAHHPSIVVAAPFCG
jgi:membrane-associated phospholipid phosphatase